MSKLAGKIGTAKRQRQYARRLGLVVAALCLTGAPIKAANIGFTGQVTGDIGSGLRPLAAETISFTDEAGIRLVVSNPGTMRSSVYITVYEGNSRLVEAETFPRSAILNAGSSTEFVVIVPFDGKVTRKLAICAKRSEVDVAKRRVCGDYTIHREFFD